MAPRVGFARYAENIRSNGAGAQPTLRSTVGKEIAQLAKSLVRRLVGEVMAAGQRLGAADVGGVARPDRLRVMMAADAAGRAPQDQHRTGDFSASVEVLRVHLEVDTEGRAIILAHGVHGRRILEAADVFGERRLVEEAQALLGLRQLLAD